jgi:hypothetical protein
VAPGADDTVTITVHRPGKTTLLVSAQGMVSELTVSLTSSACTSRAMFSRVGMALSGPSQVCEKRAFLPNVSWGVTGE